MESPESHAGLKKALFAPADGKALWFRKNQGIYGLVVMSALPFRGVNGSFDNAVGDAGTDDAQCIPEAPMENHMPKVPYPFKVYR